MTKSIKNTLYGYHFNSKYWQNYKLNLPKLPENCLNISVGMILGDATMYHVSREAYINFEQGWKQEEFLYHLFDIFSNYCFMQQPSIRLDNNQKLKSYWFKTFSFPDFSILYNLFYENKKKIVRVGLIKNYLTPIGFAYWIMCDGSLQKDGKTLIIHT